MAKSLGERAQAARQEAEKRRADEEAVRKAEHERQVEVRAETLTETVHGECETAVMAAAGKRETSVQVSVCYAVPYDSVEYDAALKASDAVAARLRDDKKLKSIKIERSKKEANIADGDYAEGGCIAIRIEL